jgi:hypothetical protein
MMRLHCRGRADQREGSTIPERKHPTRLFKIG